MAKRIVIGGASGFIGRHLVRSLRSRGHRVISVDRRRAAADDADALTWSDVERCGLPDGVEAVCNLSGRSLLEVNPAERLLPSAHRQFTADLFASRIGRIRCLAAAAAAARPIPPARLVGVSAVGYYPSGGFDQAPTRNAPVAVYDEYYSGPPDASLAGRLCAQIEAAVFDTAAAGEAAATRRIAVRMGVVLGRDGGALAGMHWPFWLGLGGPVAGGRQPVAWVHIRDAVGVLEHALLAADLPPPSRAGLRDVLNAVAPAADTSADLAAALAASLGRPAIFRTPGPVVRFVFGAERAPVLTDGAFVAPKRTLESGYRFLFTDLRAAMRDLYGS